LIHFYKRWAAVIEKRDEKGREESESEKVRK